LNVRTAAFAGGVTPDLTTRAKIRDAAIAHFARDGFDRANLRAIATTAGVSAGLVIHHFGSKAGLRQACDAHVLGTLLSQARREASPSGLQDVIRGYLAEPEAFQLQIDYLGRAVSEDSPAGRQFVDALVDETESIIASGIANGSMRPSSDVRALAAVVATTSLALLTMSSHVSRALGHSDTGPDLMRRLAVPSLELYTRGLYTDESFLLAAQQALQAQRP
jgi:AcrR family transcriptional regulator